MLNIRQNYESWKGTGIYSNPTAITAGNIRPIYNKNYTNTTIYKHGLARPLKQYRKGISVLDNTHNQIKTNRTGSLIGQLIDRPGEFSVKQNTQNQEPDCKGIQMVTDYYPETNITNKPLAINTMPNFCCNAQKNALKRTRSASTILSKNYYTTHEQYRQNRCQTFEQKSFNFYSGPVSNTNNLYVANCYPNTPHGCKLVVYKPNNPQFATEGGVDSSTRTFKLAVTTIETNKANY
jgi:hypothetical protein